MCGSHTLIPGSHLKPGGYIELHEFNLPVKCTEATASLDGQRAGFVEWGDYLIEAGLHVGLDFNAPAKFTRMLQEIGFEDVTIKWQNWPINTWAKVKAELHFHAESFVTADSIGRVRRIKK